MTCIVGIVDKENDCVIMGADSLASSDVHKEVRKDTKIFRNGEFTIGCTSSYRMIQLLQYSFVPPPVNTTDIHRYMCTDFVNAVRSCFTEGGFLKKEDTGKESGGTFLVAYKNRLFSIEDEFEVGEIHDNYNAVGSGFAFALGSLHATDGMSIYPHIRVRMALNAAAHHSPSVGGVLMILTTKELYDDEAKKLIDEL
jgi:ATP-dependent protease HslVU (ClpYQ) peptidase subunit